MTIERMTTLDQLDAVRAPWEALRAASPRSSVFASHGWTRLWLSHFGQPGRWSVLTAWDGKELAGVMPLVTTRTTWRQLPVRRLGLCINNHSPRGAFVAMAGQEQAVLSSILGELRRSGEWDMMLLENIDDPQVVLGSAPANGMFAHTRSLLPQCWLTLDGGYEKYLGNLPSSLRKSLRRSERHLAELGRLSLSTSCGSADVKAAVQTFISLDAESWKRDGGQTIVSEPSVHRFYRDVFDHFAERGELAVILLSVGGEAVCGVVCIHDRGTVYAFKSSYRTTLSGGQHLDTPRTSPGLHIYLEMIRHAFESGAQSLDFMARYPAIERFTDERRTYASVVLYRRAFYSRPLSGIDWVASRLGGRKREACA